MPKRKNKIKVSKKRKKLSKSYQAVSLHRAHQAGVSRLQRLAEELRIRFQIIKTHQDAVNPDVLYFLPAEADPAFNNGNISTYRGGYIFYQWAFQAVRWGCVCDCDNVVSIAAMRKWIKDPHSLNEECIVCMGDIIANDHKMCLQCHCMMCYFCVVKHALNEQGVRACNSSRSNCCSESCWCHLQGIPSECVQCRTPLYIDLYHVYYHLIDRLDEFNPEQRRLLEEMRDLDPAYPAVRKWLLKAQAFKPGALVVLRELNKQEWNGKVCEITGRHVETNGIRRWPVRLKDGSRNIVHVKEENMKMFNCPALKMNRFTKARS